MFRLLFIILTVSPLVLFSQEETAIQVLQNCVMEAELRVLSTSQGSPKAGPYVPGETVRFRFAITNYQTDPPGTGNDCQWLQGIIPVFGNGWAPSSFRADGRPVAGFRERLTGDWDWLPEDSVGYNFPTDEYNIFTDPVFNRLAITKDFSGPGIQSPEEPLPAGLFISTADRAPCLNAGEDPDDSWGVTQDCGTSADLGFFDFRLTVRDYEGPEGCLETGFDECWVEIFTFTDGEIGCVEGSNELCAEDPSFRFEAENLCIPSNAAFRYYNQRDPLCGSAEVNDFEIEMNQNPPYPNEDWPGCNAPQDLSAPHWLTFVANAENIELELEVDNCENGDGVLWSLYKLPCDGDIGRLNVNSPTTNLSAPFGGCQSAESPQIGTQLIDFTAEPGQLYGILVDGWQGDYCQLKLNMINGGEIPILADVELMVEFDSQLYGYISDSVCVGAEDVEIRVQDVDGACGYRWTYRSDSLNSTRYTDEPMIFYDFPFRDTVNICVSATNICHTTETTCIDLFVASSKASTLQRDTICEGERYTWLDASGDTIRAIPPQNESGLQQFRDTLEDVGLCQLLTLLDLYVRPENNENPTLVDTFICYEPDQDISLFFFCDTVKGIDTIPIQACTSPTTGCDTFFRIEFNVIGGELDITAESCNGFGSMVFGFEDPGLEGYTPWSIQLSKYENDPDYELRYQWTTNSGARLLGQDPELVLPQNIIEQFAQGNTFALSLLIEIVYRGNVVCSSSAGYDFSLRDNFPRVQGIFGAPSFSLGQENLKYWADIRNPRRPDHDQPADQIFMREWQIPPGFSFVPPSDPTTDTLLMNAPETLMDTELCLEVTTDLCGFSDKACLDLEQTSCPAEIVPLDSCGKNVFGVSADLDTIFSYEWTVSNGEIIGPNNREIVMVNPEGSDSTILNLVLRSNCIGLERYAIAPGGSSLVIENVDSIPREFYRRDCNAGALLVITEEACGLRWGYLDSLTGAYRFPLLGPEGNVWREAYLEVPEEASNFRSYFVERTIDCDQSNCESEILWSRNAIRVPCSKHEIRLYPNPNDASFQLDMNGFTEGSYRIEVFNSVGRKVFVQNTQVNQAAQKEFIDLGRSAPGLHQLLLYDGANNLMGYETFIVIP